MKPLMVLLCVGTYCTAEAGSWKQLGSGMNNTVYALTVYNGQLIAAGNFTLAGGNSVNNIAAWDGEAWHALGGGANSAVYALTVYDDQLIAGGVFTTAEGQSVNCITRWDGKSWQPLGNGMSGGVGGAGTRVLSLALYEGELIAGGDFMTAGIVDANNVARWDGRSWHPLGDGMNGYVRALASYAGELVASGSFFADGTTYPLARWDGATWHSFASIETSANALTILGDDLIAGGSGYGVSRWDGSSWQPVGTGLTYSVFAVCPFQGGLIAGGNFWPDEGSGFIFSRIARWNGSEWDSMDGGMNHEVDALTVFGDQLVAGGDFGLAGGEPANHIARWAPCPADVTDDDVVNTADLLTIIALWGNPGGLGGAADVNHDGFVNAGDLLAVINGWGLCP